jgi:hypothetical protein
MSGKFSRYVDVLQVQVDIVFRLVMLGAMLVLI